MQNTYGRLVEFRSNNKDSKLVNFDCWVYTHADSKEEAVALFDRTPLRYATGNTLHLPTGLSSNVMYDVANGEASAYLMADGLFVMLQQPGVTSGLLGALVPDSQE